MKSYPLPYSAFLERMKSGDLTGLKCLECDACIIPPNAVCPECGSSRLEIHSFSKNGTLKTLSLIHI